MKTSEILFDFSLWNIQKVQKQLKNKHKLTSYAVKIQFFFDLGNISQNINLVVTYTCG